MRADDGRRRVQVCIRGPRRLVRCVANQARQSEEQHGDTGAHGGAQRARRFAVQLELPPEIVRVLDVFECEEPQPD